jgi:L-ribulose-5-phosphate 4-epimerase
MGANQHTKFGDRVEEAIEQRLREEVAACTLVLNSLDILGYSGHVSARLPDEHHMLIQSFDQSRASSDQTIC